jgi:hypothetical protein
VFDSTYPSVDVVTFTKTDWKSMYSNAKEMIPSDAPFSICACLLIMVMLVSNSQGVQGLGLSYT